MPCSCPNLKKNCNNVLKCSILCNYHAKSSDYGNIRFFFIWKITTIGIFGKTSFSKGFDIHLCVICNIAVLCVLFLSLRWSRSVQLSLSDKENSGNFHLLFSWTIPWSSKAKIILYLKLQGWHWHGWSRQTSNKISI